MWFSKYHTETPSDTSRSHFWDFQVESRMNYLNISTVILSCQWATIPIFKTKWDTWGRWIEETNPISLVSPYDMKDIIYSWHVKITYPCYTLPTLLQVWSRTVAHSFAGLRTGEQVLLYESRHLHLFRMNIVYIWGFVKSLNQTWLVSPVTLET